MYRRPLSILLRGVVALVLTIATLALLPVPAAQAAVPTGPSAIAVSSNGISYVGFAAGGSLTRVDASGAVLAPITLPRTGPVDGLAVDSADNLWVSYGHGASKISPTGTELAFVAYPGVAATCPASDGATDPTRYGGIAVSPDFLYVSGRCFTGIKRFLLDGTQVGELTTSTQTRGVAWIPGQSNGQGPKIFFATPDTGKVYEYPEAWASNGGLPSFVLNVPQSGSNPPRPSGIAADRYGQLAVADAANDRVLLFDTNNKNGPNSYSWYRTLGRPGANAGDLTNPTALAQYSVDGPLTDRRGDFFVADTGNGRIQRWNTSGYTYWSAAVGGSGGPGPTPTAPVNTALPSITGTPAVGQTLTCSTGSWSGSPTSYSYGWNRNGSSISGQNASTYTVQTGDAGQGISCFVRATNAAGTSDYATSASVPIATGASAPTSSAAPTISGSAVQGQALTCGNGSWTGSPTSYARVWNRNGSPIPGATGTTYTLVAADVGQAITCTVTATNAAGSSSATSASVTPSGPSTCTGTPGTVSINAGATFTTSEAVTLRIRPPAGATAVMIANDGGFDGVASQPLSGSCTYAWTLALSGSTRDGKVVYVRFLNSSAAEVLRASDDIVLDKTVPAFSGRQVVQRVGRSYRVTLSASDRVSGLAKVEYAATRSGKATKVSYQRTFTTKQPARFTWVRVHDRAGNVSAWKRTVRA